MHRLPGWLASLIALALFVTGCADTSREEDAGSLSIRLVDVFEEDWISGTPEAHSDDPDEVTPTEWNFAEPPPPAPPAPPGTPPDPWAETRGFRPLAGVENLRIEDGRLAGRVVGPVGIVAVADAVPPGEDDVLHEIRIRLAVSAGEEIAVQTFGSMIPTLDVLRGAESDLPWSLRAALEPGESARTYTLRPPKTLPATSVRYLLLRPTDAPEATFAIESVRLVFRGEYLAGIPSGVGWQGLDEHYRETVVVRTPEVIRWPIEVPAAPRFDLAIGTVEDEPVRFRVSAGGRTLFEETVTTPQRWHAVELDLSSFAGENVELEMAVDAPSSEEGASEGLLGFWGSPALRRAAPPERAEQDGPRGVIVVFADTLRADRLDLYGHERETAPNLSALAAGGTTFDHAVAQGTWTKVSAPSIFTGLYPTTHGISEATDRLPATATTLAEALRASGRATVGLVSVPFVGTASNLHQGYEELVEYDNLGDPKTARRHVDVLVEWLEQHRDVPFYAMLHVFDPHNPFEPRPPWSSRFADPAWHEEHRRDAMTLRRKTPHVFPRITGMATPDELVEVGLDPERFLARETAWYDGSILGMDAEIGRLVEALRHLDLLDDVLLVVLSDHGEEFHEHGRMFHGQSVYGELTRVPLVVRWPGHVAEGRRVEEVVQTIDVMPTILDLVGSDMPEAVQGRSLSPWLDPAADGNGARAVPAISEQPVSTSPGSPPPRDVGSTAIVHDGWKLVHHHAGRAEDRPEYELFDAQDDPLDQRDMAAEHPEVVERLAGLLADWRRSAEAARLPEDTEGIDPEELERLRALGYVQ